jgi:catechol 2,3-dioxygenase-like lactoylglutathione lyase family enzyme
MAKITGIGGVFIKTDVEATRAWLDQNLGLETQAWGTYFQWREHDDPQREGGTVLGLHGRDSTYFGPSTREVMLNFRVDDLDGMLARLKERGVEIVKVLPPDENGRFAHVRGPDGLVLELWQPPG